jgi:hypothetical protein
VGWPALAMIATATASATPTLLDPFAPPAPLPTATATAARGADAGSGPGPAAPPPTASTPAAGPAEAGARPVAEPPRPAARPPAPAWPRSPWDARGPVGAAHAAAYGSLVLGDEGLGGTSPRIGVSLGWTPIGALSLRLDAQALPIGLRLTPLYRLLSWGPLTVAAQAPAAFFGVGELSVSGFGAGAVTTLGLEAFALTLAVDGGWYQIGRPGRGAVEHTAVVTVRSAVWLDVAIGTETRLGVGMELQPLPSFGTLVSASAFVSREL